MEVIKDNPDLVAELIDENQTMDSKEFDRKYESLNPSDRMKVAEATITMESFFVDDKFIDYEEEEEGYEEELNVYDAAMIWTANGKEEEYMFGYTEEELKEALRF